MFGCKKQEMRKLRNISILLISQLLLMSVDGCTKQIILSPDGGKTPLEFATLISTGFTEIPQTKADQTKAENTTFNQGDKLYTYLQHVDGSGNLVGSFAKLCEVSVNKTTSGVLNNWTVPNPALTANNLYWEDFTNSTNDIRTSGHGLRSLYAYCYNGGTPSTALNEATGVIGWTVQADQSAGNGFRKSDLLMAPTTAKVAYKHSTTSQMNGDHGVIPLEFTHAMSKITVEVVADETFSGDIFSNTKVILSGVNTTCTVNAPSQSLSGYGSTSAPVTMQPASRIIGKTKSFSAVIAPTVIRGGADAEHAVEFATLEDVGGYNYKVMLTKDAIEKAPAGAGKVSWSSKLTDHDASSVTPASPCGKDSEGTEHYTSANGGLTIPGVNYLITVKVKRTGIEVSATIADWKTASADETGKIQFTDAFPNTGEIDQKLKAHGFDVYARSVNDASYGGVASVVSWNPTAGEQGEGAWEYHPQLYWPSGTYQSYFRALAPSTSEKTLEAGEYSDERDVLWGVNSKEEGYYEMGAPINPRTGKIPLSFYHAMARITFNLLDAHADDPYSHGHGSGHGHGADPHLNLAGAKIALYNLAGTGTLDLDSGETIPGARILYPTPMLEGYYAANDSSAPEGAKVLKNYLVIPQSMLSGEPYAEITLADGTKYRMDLKHSVSETPGGEYGIFNEWKSGTDYTYNVYLSKETITFRALIQDWDKKIGSGSADLEWD